MSKSVSSPSKVCSKTGKEREELAEKLKSINDRLHKVHEQRKQMSPISKYSIASKASHGMASSKKKKKRMLYHPKLDLIIAENCYSPYLTKPTRPYSEKTLRVPLQIKELRFCGSDVNAEGFPVKMEKARKVFIKDIIEYKAHFEFHEEKTNLPMQYINPPPEFFIPDVHAKPQERSMVYPNTYEPLKGHTGKLPNLVSYIRHDPNRPKTTPTLLKRASSVEDCEKLLEELESQRPGTAPGSEHAILRQGSGSLKAHAGRGGPEKYRQEVRFRKAVKELKRMISSGSFDEEDGDGHDGLFFAEDDHTDFDGIYECPADQGGVEATDRGDTDPDAKPVATPDNRTQDQPEWNFDLAVICITQVTCKNLQCDSKFGEKSVYAALKYGKMWSAKTPVVSNAPNPVTLLPYAGSKSMAFQVTPEAMSAMRLSVTVFNANHDRPDYSYGMCKVELSELLRKDPCETSLTRDIVTKAGAKGGKVIVTFNVMSKEEYDALAEQEDFNISSEAQENPKNTVNKTSTKSNSGDAVKNAKASSRAAAETEEKAAKSQSKSVCDDNVYGEDFDDERSEAKSVLSKESKSGYKARPIQEDTEEYVDDGYGEDFDSISPEKTASQTLGLLNCDLEDLPEGTSDAVVASGGSAESGLVCVGGDLEHSCDDDRTNKSGPASGQDLQEKSVFYDLSAEDEDCVGDTGGLSTRSMMLGDSGLVGLGVEMPSGEDSKNTMAAVMEDLIHDEDNAAVSSAQAGESYEDDFIYDDEDDDGSFVSAEIQRDQE